MPKVSVLIASYNHEKYIGYAIQSVLGQTYQDFEIVIVDDGSKDNSVEVIRSFTDPRIRLICFEQNQGACTAAKRLLQEAKGEYIAILNSDDAFLPEKLAKQVDFLDKNDKYGAVFSYAQIIDEAGEIFTDENHFYSKIFVQENKSRHEWLRYFFYNGNCLCHPSIMIRSECYESVGFYDERYYQLPDFDFWIRLCLKYEIYIIPENLIEFRVRENEANASGTRMENSIRNNNEYLRILENYLKIDSEEEFFNIFPQSSSLKSKNGFLLPYALAMICLDAKVDKIYNCFALQLLYKALLNPEFLNKAAAIYGFTLQKFYDMTKTYDVFGVFKVDITKPNLIGITDKGSVSLAIDNICLKNNIVYVSFLLENVLSIKNLIFKPVADWPCKVCFERIVAGKNCLQIEPVAQSIFGDDLLVSNLAPEFKLYGDWHKEQYIELSYEVKFFEWDEVIVKYISEILCKDQIINEQCAVIVNKDAIIEEKDAVIAEREKYIECLIEQRDLFMHERDEILKILQDVYHSKGYRCLSAGYRWRDKLKKLIDSDTYTKINLADAMRNIDKDKVEKFYYYLRTEDFSRVMARVKNYFSGYINKREQPIDVSMPEEQINYDQLVLPISSKPLVSIIIPVYNKWEYTYNCIKCIMENTNDVEYEIIVADDVSSDLTKDIKQYIKNIIVSRNETNLGFLQNCNNAALVARGEYIHFLNNDTNVQKGWLSTLVSLMQEDNKIGMCGSKLVYADGRLQEAGGIVWNDASAWNYGRLDNPAKPEYNYVKEVDYISGASILIRKTLWLEIGGFDERYIPAYYEDTDLAFEVRAHGYKVVYQPLSVVVHFEGVSNGSDLSQGMKRFQQINYAKFFEKWQTVLEKDHFPNGEHVLLARDRSKGKKVIIVVDHYVPHYDCDAGGRCTFHYLNFFVQLGMHVLFVGDNYFKHEPYTTVLNQLGIEVFYGDWNLSKFEKWLSNHGKYIDYAYLNRPHISVKYMDMMKQKTNAKIFYFGHDLHFIREHRQYEIEGNPQLLASAEEWKKKEMALFNKADVVHVVGAYEQAVLEELLPNKPIRNIPLYLYDEKMLNSLPKAIMDKRDKLIFVGGFNHKPNEDAVLWFMEEIYPIISKRIPDLKFYIIGSKPTKAIEALATDAIIVTGYVDDARLEELYNEARVSVVPLRYGAGIKGKIIEAMYYKVPIVTTTIGAEGLPEVDKCVKVTDNPQEYASGVIHLFENDKLWQEQSEKELDYIKMNFTKENAKKILSLDM